MEIAIVKERVQAAVRDAGHVTVLCGAGISAESGIPTFRGPEGYWTVGSTNYMPQEIGTQRMFRRHPRDVWRWYLYRRGVCHAAAPNPGHQALVDLETILSDRFTLITQNVDGLHRRAGNSAARTYEIHGNIDLMRCANPNDKRVFPIPDGVMIEDRDGDLTIDQWEQLHLAQCGGLARPHVLWWDEYYDEALYRFDSTLRVAMRTALLITVGTSGATTLPNHVVQLAYEAGALLIDVNIEDNLFGRAAIAAGGFALRGPSGTVLPQIANWIREAVG